MRGSFAGLVGVIGLCGCMPPPHRSVVASTLARSHPPAHRSLAASAPHSAGVQNAFSDPAEERLFQDFLIWRAQRRPQAAQDEQVREAITRAGDLEPAASN
jgi:hypothetical protein